jgi:hypothetical protein
MFLRDFTISDERKVAQINKALKEAFGFTLAASIESGKLQSLYTKVADDLYNLKLNLGTVRDKEYAKKLLVKEGLGILLKKVKLDEGLLAGPGANAYERVVKWLTEFVTSACEVGDDYEEAIYDAMKHYRSSKYRFNDAMVEQDLRNNTMTCAGAEMAMESAKAGQAKGPWDEPYTTTMDPKDAKEFFGGQKDLYASAKKHNKERDAAKAKREKTDEAEQINELSPELIARADKTAAGRNQEMYDRLSDKQKEKGLADPDYRKWSDKGAQRIRFNNSNVQNIRAGKRTLGEDPGHSILDIITPEELERLRGYVEGNGDFYRDEVLFDKLYSYYVNSGEMPYGVAKARDGDPDIWILDQVQDDYGDEVSGLEEGNPDRYADREWASQLAAEQPERREFARKLGPKKVAKDPEGEDYYSYMSKKKTTRETTEMKEGYVKKLRALLEAEVEQAESIIAAKGFSQELQDMVEKLGRLVNEDLPAVTDQMRDAYGSDVATGFENAVGQTLSGVMDSLKSSKQEVDVAVDSIASGGMPSATSDMESPEVNALDGAEGDLDAELDADLDLDIGDDLGMGDDFGGADAVAGEDEPLGRAKKESVNKAAQLSRKILETKAKIAKAKKVKDEKAKDKAKSKEEAKKAKK